MAYETKDNTGSIFKNDRKEKDTHPDRTGACRIDGKDYWVSGWIKQDRNGNQYMSLAFKPKETKRPENDAESAPVKPRSSADMDDEIPFAPEFR